MPQDSRRKTGMYEILSTGCLYQVLFSRAHPQQGRYQSVWQICCRMQSRSRKAGFLGRDRVSKTSDSLSPPASNYSKSIITTGCPATHLPTNHPLDSSLLSIENLFSGESQTVASQLLVSQPPVPRNHSLLEIDTAHTAASSTLPLQVQGTYFCLSCLSIGSASPLL